jgi:hypothetical protein
MLVAIVDICQINIKGVDVRKPNSINLLTKMDKTIIPKKINANEK